MKLLSWMHRKFWQNSGDVFKDFPGGGTCSCLSGRPSLEEENLRRRHHLNPVPSRSLRLPAAAEEFVQDSGTGGGGGGAATMELFGGLLAIGTLGIGAGPIEEEEAMAEEEVEATPAFGAAAIVEAIAEKQAEATTETDLMVVNAELEKVLAVEAEKAAAAAAAGDRLSSARPSHVSAGSAACPLQGFLFGSPIEIAETTPAAGGRKERRASLGELFMRSRIAEEGGGKREEATVAGGAASTASDGDGRSTAGMHLMKKLKRRGSRVSSRDPGETSAETKFQKILQIFHRKVHPENTAAAKKPARPGKKNGGDRMHHGGGNDFNGSRGAAMTATKGACRKEGIPKSKFCSNSSSLALGGSDSNGNREHWIKTDADYLVLEL